MKLAAYLLSLLVTGLAFAGDAKSTKVPTGIVGDEFEKTHTYFVKTFKDNQQLITNLKKEREQVISQAKDLAGFYQDGVDSLIKYDLLLMVRNTDDNGEYQKGNEVASQDVSNLNAIFQKYLKSTLMPEKTSARYARKVIVDAITVLEGKVSDCQKPDEDNNPQLEIIEKRIKDATRKTELVRDFAKNIGIDIKREIASSETPVVDIVPPVTVPSAVVAPPAPVRPSKRVER